MPIFICPQLHSRWIQNHWHHDSCRWAKNVLEETLNKTIPINQDCKWLPSQFRAKRKDFLFESVREEVFMNFNVVILNKTRVVYKNIYCRFSVIDLQLLYSSLGKNECNKWYLSKECWFVIFSLVVDWAFLFSCLNALFEIIS